MLIKLIVEFVKTLSMPWSFGSEMQGVGSGFRAIHKRRPILPNRTTVDATDSVLFLAQYTWPKQRNSVSFSDR